MRKAIPSKPQIRTLVGQTVAHAFKTDTGHHARHFRITDTTTIEGVPHYIYYSDDSAKPKFAIKQKFDELFLGERMTIKPMFHKGDNFGSAKKI